MKVHAYKLAFKPTNKPIEILLQEIEKTPIVDRGKNNRLPEDTCRLYRKNRRHVVCRFYQI